jgi:hypothetical protein
MKLRDLCLVGFLVATASFYLSLVDDFNELMTSSVLYPREAGTQHVGD